MVRSFNLPARLLIEYPNFIPKLSLGAMSGSMSCIPVADPFDFAQVKPVERSVQRAFWLYPLAQGKQQPEKRTPLQRNILTQEEYRA